MNDLITRLGQLGSGGRTHGLCIMGLIMISMNMLGVAEFEPELINAVMLAAGVTLRESIDSSTKRLRMPS